MEDHGAQMRLARLFITIAVVGIGHAALAGDFDGKWSGDIRSGRSACRPLTIDLIISGLQARGSVTYDGKQYPSAGTLQADGSYIGHGNTIRGKFSGDSFEGQYTPSRGAQCDYLVRMKKG